MILDPKDRDDRASQCVGD